MDQLVEDLTLRVLAALDTVAPSGAASVAGTLTRNHCLAALLFLLLGCLLGSTIGYVMHRLRTHSTPPTATATAAKPLYVLVAVTTAFFTSMPFVLTISASSAFAGVARLIEVSFHWSALGALLWFVLRLSLEIESRFAAWTAKTPSRVDDLMVPLVGSSVRVLVILAAVLGALSLLDLPPRYDEPSAKVSSIAVILAVAILLIRAVRVGESMILTRYDVTAADNLRARKVYTQIHVIGRVVYVAIAFLSAAAILMLFDRVRHLGTSLLASAGIAGIIVGFAAQKTLANLFAGFQIALAQPMREDDVVIVEGEWGRIEEINLSYVVVHLWDDRRLILPLSYFIEKPFQNWTRTSSAIMGSVVIYLDYGCDVQLIRRELEHIVESNALWDRRFWNLQVTDAREGTVELRVLATSANASMSFDLRCDIREQIIELIRRTHPEWLPRRRVEWVGRQPRDAVRSTADA